MVEVYAATSGKAEVFSVRLPLYEGRVMRVVADAIAWERVCVASYESGERENGSETGVHGENG